jgi:hypothetical protein
MRFIPTRVHGVLDYSWSALLAATPWLAGSGGRGRETEVALAFAAGATAYSLLTDYELGAAGVLPMRTHLRLDVAGGLLLAASPWLLGFAGRVWAPYAGFGLFSVAAGLLTQTRPQRHAAAHFAGAPHADID